jgi:catechol 2,3-dioxygenase-like lactoylglutathione lyase family enzyme
MSADTGVIELEHVLVLSDDIERSREFYERALGLHAGDRPRFSFDGYWLYAGGRPCVHIADRTSYRAHSRTLGLEVPSAAGGPGPIDHIAFSGADYDAHQRRLQAIGVQPVRNQIPGGGPRQLFFDDPDGTRVEINFPRSQNKAGVDD